MPYFILSWNGIYESGGYVSNIRKINYGFDSYDIAYGIVIINQVKGILITKIQNGKKLGVMQFELCDAWESWSLENYD